MNYLFSDNCKDELKFETEMNVHVPVVKIEHPDEILEIIEKATRRKPGERYASAAEMIGDIDRILEKIQVRKQQRDREIL